MSCVKYHMSHVTCHLSHVTCHMPQVTCKLFLGGGQNGEASHWRICYQRGLPRLVFLPLHIMFYLFPMVSLHEVRDGGKVGPYFHPITNQGYHQLPIIDIKMCKSFPKTGFCSNGIICEICPPRFNLPSQTILHLINRSGVAGAVLQIPLSLTE